MKTTTKITRYPAALTEAAKLAAVDRLLQQNYCPFLRVAFETIVPGEQLHLNWHIKAFANALERVAAGKTKRLIITVPPRSLKSISVNVAFPAFLLGQNPAIKIVCASYSNELATKHSIDCRNLMKSPFYRRVFPGTVISRDKDTETEILTTKRGGRYATSVGGTLTGRGGSLLIIDDPMNPKQAMSDILRKNVIDWYRHTAYTRLNLKGEDAIIIVMQRLHEVDLVGALLEEGGWEHLDIPAIADRNEVIPIGDGKVHRRRIGDVIDEVREPLSVLMDIKRSLGSLTFSSQYLQRPLPADGNILRREWFRYYVTAPEKLPNDKLFVSWDTAMKDTQYADYSVGTVWLVRKDTCYLLDLIRGKYNFPELKQVVLATRTRWKGSIILVEDKGSGTSLIQELRRDNITVIPIKPVGTKEDRVSANAATFEGGSVLFPEKAPWLDDLLAELLAFPRGRNDDQVDSVSQLLTHVRLAPRAVLAGAITFRIGNPFERVFPSYGHGTPW